MHSCFVVDNTKADALNANCGLMEGTLGTACPTGAVKKCELSNGMTEYLYNASDDCQG